MNMTQLAFIKRLDCVKRVKTNEGINPFPVKEAVSESIEATTIVADIHNEVMTEASFEAELNGNDGIAVASVGGSARSSCCPCASNTDMESAQEIEIERSVNGCICCPGSEQWFKFTVPETKVYTIHTTGSLDTIGTLYDQDGNCIIEVDDYKACGKLNFRIIRTLNANTTYYVKVKESKSNTGSYILKVTNKTLVQYINVNSSLVILQKGNTYELPIQPNTFVPISSAEQLSNLSATTVPSNADEKKVIWISNDNDVIHIESDWHNGKIYQTLTAVGVGNAELLVYDWLGNGKPGKCNICVTESTTPKVTVMSCSNPGWIASSKTMGEDMAAAFNCDESYSVHSPTTASEFETCWREAKECIIIHTHGSPTALGNQDENDSKYSIIQKNEICNLPINNKVRFIMMTACETAGGTANNNVAYWLSKKINPNGIVIANTDVVEGDDTYFSGYNKNPTWKVYKNGSIQRTLSNVTLTMSSAYGVYTD